MSYENRRIAYWLTPNESEIQELINTLATRYKTPTFLPHITLFITAVNPNKTPQEIFSQISKEALTLKINGIECGTTLTKTPEAQRKTLVWCKIRPFASGLGFYTNRLL